MTPVQGAVCALGVRSGPTRGCGVWGCCCCCCCLLSTDAIERFQLALFLSLILLQDASSWAELTIFAPTAVGVAGLGRRDGHCVTLSTLLRDRTKSHTRGAFSQ